MKINRYKIVSDLCFKTSIHTLFPETSLTLDEFATLLTHDNLPKMALNDLKLPSKDPLVCKIKFQLGSLFYNFLI